MKRNYAGSKEDFLFSDFAESSVPQDLPRRMPTAYNCGRCPFDASGGCGSKNLCINE
jgi:hypothetical protein